MIKKILIDSLLLHKLEHNNHYSLIFPCAILCNINKYIMYFHNHKTQYYIHIIT